MKLMAEVYCARTEIQKMESELWNLTIKNNDLAAYTQRFQELTMLCTKMVFEEDDRVEKFIGGLPDNIQGNVIVVEPTRLQDVVRMDNNLMDQKLKEGSSSESESLTCYECGKQGHYKSDCPKLKDYNRRNKTGNKNGIGEARRKAYVLDVSYSVELADGRVFETNTILKGCTLGLLGHPFNIKLMPVELGCFDIIIGMDWLANHHAVIMCDKKIVRIPYGDEVLIVQGDRSGKGKKSKLSIISSVLAVLKPERLKADRARRLLISVLLFTVCEEASKVESFPSDIILDDLLALDSIVRFDLGNRRLEQTGSITEFVYLVEAHYHLNPIFIPKGNNPRRLDDGVVMLVLEARGYPLRFGEVHQSLVALNPKLEVFYALSYNQLSGPLVDGRSENLLVFR
nr:reverse transcriptase domain-containing protein [Tanacetum cinerariifolium]